MIGRIDEELSAARFQLFWANVAIVALLQFTKVADSALVSREDDGPRWRRFSRMLDSIIQNVKGVRDHAA
jgi:hypothetical protein